jgi:hypothetical protein
VLVRFRSRCPLRRKRESRREVIDCETSRNRLRVKFALPEPTERQRPVASIIRFGCPAAWALQPPCPQTAFSGVQTATTRQQGLTTLWRMHGSVSRPVPNRPQGGGYSPSEKYPEHEKRNRILPAIRLPSGLPH